MPRWFLVLFALAPACALPGFDRDQDGYITADDCDDTQASVRPGAAERCNAIDDDCDGAVDEDLGDALFADSDGDGYGDGDVRVAVCNPSQGAVTNGRDCDDDDASVHPGTVERCDGTDNDCDEQTDDPTAIDAMLWHADADGDGYGDPWAETWSCTAPEGAVAGDDDCDDADAAIRPGAIETCDGIDNDCDGWRDGITATDLASWYADADGDGHGAANTEPMRACNAPPLTASTADDCDDTRSDIHAGAEEFCDGADNDCNDAIDDAPTRFDQPGIVTVYTDNDRDGYGGYDDGELACAGAIPVGMAIGNDDCNDFDRTITPDTVSYADADGDGYGDSATAELACASWSSGGATIGGDCDDRDSATYPGALEVCTVTSGYYSTSTPADEDCDGVADEGCPVSFCAPITVDTTWRAGEERHVTCTVTVQDGATLTIERGARVAFDASSGLNVGSYGNPGHLIVEGESGAEVRFTSSAAAPAPGAWTGLMVYKGSADLAFTLIEYAGATGAAVSVQPAGGLRFDHGSIARSLSDGLEAESTDLSIKNIAFLDNGGNGMVCADACLDGETDSLVGSRFEGNAGVPLRLRAADIGWLARDLRFSGNLVSAVEITGGTIGDDASWPALDVPYRVTETIRVGDNARRPTLTLEDGVTLAFASNAGLRIAEGDRGDLVTEGGTLGVTLTDLGDNVPGDWSGLVLGTYTSAKTNIVGTTIEYAGEYGYASVQVSGRAKITDTVIQHGADDALVVTGRLSLSDATIEDNAGFGIDLASSATLETLDGTVVTGNGDAPLRGYANHLGALTATNRFSGNAVGYDNLLVRGGGVTRDATWPALDVPYAFLASIWVDGTDAPVLTLEAGVQTEWAASTGLNVGCCTAGDLVLAGDTTSGNLVKFTNRAGAGTWLGLRLHSGTSSATQLEGFELTNAGSSDAALYLYSGTATVDRGRISNAYKTGIYATDSYLAVTNTRIEGTRTSNTTTRPDGDGVVLAGRTRVAAWSGNTITGNARYPVNLGGRQLVDLDPGSATANAYTGNTRDQMYIRGYVQDGLMPRSGNWVNPGIPWLVDGNLYLHCPDVPCTPPVVRMTGGTVQFTTGSSLTVGGWPGELIANNVTFTSSRASKLAGDWDGVYFRSNSGVGSALTNCTIEYGGSYQANLILDGASGTFTNNTIRNSAKWGIYRSYPSPRAVISPNTFASNPSGNVY